MVHGAPSLFCPATALALVVTACGGAPPKAVGTSPADDTRRPVELALRTSSGAPLFLEDLRGSPVILFIFATYDGVSQAALRPLERFMRHTPDVVVLGIAAQPTAKDLVDAWVHALDPSFAVAYDPEERIAQGTSPLGILDAVPTFVLLDENGYEVDRFTGFASEGTLRRMLERHGRAK